MSLSRAAELVAGARRGVALTGAGISAESGIPTFRGEGGLWRQYDPVKVATLENFLADPTQYWLVARERGPAVMAAKPNAAHMALAELEEAGHLSAVVTQNTDGLHRDAGSRRVIELHGTGRTVQCLDCGRIESRGDVQTRLIDEMPPRCAVCGGTFLKPTVVFFGEQMPADAVAQAFELAREADLMLVVGSSLVVYPAAEIPLVAARAGVPIVLVNAEPTPMDDLAEVVIHGRAGEVLPEISRLSALVAQGG
ncbi:MAG TPA: NAD-dependent deacylase [Candidatus Dormibacteraeota bacterium]|nr:NAD-dependent deacylase [Candidatus Dormibacteraeota bacterium]